VFLPDRHARRLDARGSPSERLASARDPLRRFRRRPRTRWPAGRPRILVADAWLANAGDGAISLATDALIRQVSPGAAILHAAHQSDVLRHHYPSLDFVPPLAAILGVSPRPPEAEGWDEGDLAAIVAEADVVLSQGGGFLIERYKPWRRLATYERALELGVPYGFVAQTIGRFEQEEKRASLARAIRGATVVGVRDRRSLENVVDLGRPESRVRLAADAAFALFPSPPEPADRSGVALVLSRHPPTGENGFASDDPELVASLTEVVRRVAEVIAPESLTLFSTTQGLGSLDRRLEDDEPLAKEVIAGLPERLRRQIRHVRGYLAPDRAAELIARHRALISMRMHPLIFALSQGVPAVAVTKAHKVLDLLTDLGMEDMVAPWLDPRGIEATLRTALEPGAPQGTELWTRLDGARRRADVNGELVAELLAVAPGS
jgi:polysaccharide pyruvyl transferase WcaK-like protein